MFNCNIKQVDKKEDFIMSGYNKMYNFNWIVVADGHGKCSLVIDCLRQLFWNEIIVENDIYTIIKSHINLLGDTLYSGATISIVKIFQTYIECYWIGDSTIRIYKDRKEVFRSNDHTEENSEEMDRLYYLSVPKRSDDLKLEIISDEIITMKKAINFIFGDFEKKKYVKLNLTHSLGHNGLTGDFMSYHKEFITTNNSEYKVVVASDGLWNMIIGNNIDNEILSDPMNGSLYLMKFSLNRWNKEWNYLVPTFNKLLHYKKIEKGDDICIGVWSGRVSYIYV